MQDVFFSPAPTTKSSPSQNICDVNYLISASRTYIRTYVRDNSERTSLAVEGELRMDGYAELPA